MCWNLSLGQGAWKAEEKRPRSAEVVADENVEAYLLTEERFEAILHEHPRIGRALLASIARQLVHSLRDTYDELRSVARSLTMLIPPQKAVTSMSDWRAAHILKDRAQAIELGSESHPVARLQVLDGLIVVIQHLARDRSRAIRAGLPSRHPQPP